MDRPTDDDTTDVPTREDGDTTDDAHDGPIDLRRALGLAGHEVEELGFEGIPDTGEVLYATQEREEGLDHPQDHVEGDIATRGQGH